VIDPTFKPSNQDEIALYVLKQNYMMSVFKTHILTDQGKSIIANYTATGKAQQVWKELEIYHKQSTQAENVCEILLNYIVTSRIDDGTWTGTAQGYLLHWNKQVNDYNEKQKTGEIKDMQKRIHLQAAVKGNPKLASIKSMSQLQGKLGSSITYQQYFDLLIEAAIQYDLEHQSSHQRHCTRRAVYQHDMELLHEDSYADFQPSSISDDDINNSYTAQMYNFDTPV